MAEAPFKPLRTGDFTLDRIQDAIARALENVANSLPAVPVLVSFVANGSNGTGTIVLPAVKDRAGNILRRAAQGAKLVAAFNLTDDTDVQTSFEQVISKTDQIQQVDTANLSAKKIAFVVQE